MRSVSNVGYDPLYWNLGSPIKSSKLQVALAEAAIEAEVNMSILSCGENDIST